MVKYVYDFSEGDKSMKDLLGGKVCLFFNYRCDTYCFRNYSYP